MPQAANESVPHHTVVVVGGGQAGLSISHYLKVRGLDHVVFEKDVPWARGPSSDGTISASSHPTGSASSRPSL